jgi:plastocyanin
MSSRIVVALGIATLIVTAGAPAARASGGGGCPPPITNGTATKLMVEDWCFEPTVTYVKPGDTITWVNRDPVPHSVTGANRAWGGYDKLKPRKSLSYSFDSAGIYPYYCVFHLGMVGTVVVWNGDSTDLMGPRGTRESVHRVRPADLIAASTTAPAGPEQPGGSRASLALALTAPTALGVWLLARRTLRRMTAPSSRDESWRI